MLDLCELFDEAERRDSETDCDNIDLAAIRAGERAEDDEQLFDFWED